jgi:hypothetical protein
MNMYDQTNKHEHEAVEKLLPWLVNRSLSVEESERVEAHLQHCEKCRSQFIQLQAINKQVAEEKSEWQLSSAHFSSILSEVEHLEAIASEQKKIKQSKSNRRSGFFQSLWQTPTPVRWTLALESMALVALLTVWNVSPQLGLQSNVGLYQTLSDSPQNSPTLNMRKIRLLLNDATTAVELTQLLQQTDAQIRQGPSALGIYIVEVPEEKAKKSLENLQNHQHIRLAELLDVAS